MNGRQPSRLRQLLCKYLDAGATGKGWHEHTATSNHLQDHVAATGLPGCHVTGSCQQAWPSAVWPCQHTQHASAKHGQHRDQGQCPHLHAQHAPAPVTQLQFQLRQPSIAAVAASTIQQTVARCGSYQCSPSMGKRALHAISGQLQQQSAAAAHTITADVGPVFITRFITSAPRARKPSTEALLRELTQACHKAVLRAQSRRKQRQELLASLQGVSVEQFSGSCSSTVLTAALGAVMSLDATYPSTTLVGKLCSAVAEQAGRGQLNPDQLSCALQMVSQAGHPALPVLLGEATLQLQHRAADFPLHMIQGILQAAVQSPHYNKHQAQQQAQQDQSQQPLWQAAGDAILMQQGQLNARISRSFLDLYATAGCQHASLLHVLCDQLSAAGLTSYTLEQLGELVASCAKLSIQHVQLLQQAATQTARWFKLQKVTVLNNSQVEAVKQLAVGFHTFRIHHSDMWAHLSKVAMQANFTGRPYIPSRQWQLLELCRAYAGMAAPNPALAAVFANAATSAMQRQSPAHQEQHAEQEVIFHRQSASELSRLPGSVSETEHPRLRWLAGIARAVAKLYAGEDTGIAPHSIPNTESWLQGMQSNSSHHHRADLEEHHQVAVTRLLEAVQLAVIAHPHRLNIRNATQLLQAVRWAHGVGKHDGGAQSTYQPLVQRCLQSLQQGMVQLQAQLETPAPVPVIQPSAASANYKKLSEPQPQLTAHAAGQHGQRQEQRQRQGTGLLYDLDTSAGLTRTLQEVMRLSQALTMLPRLSRPVQLGDDAARVLASLLSQQYSQEVEDQAALLLLAGRDPAFVKVLAHAAPESRPISKLTSGSKPSPANQPALAATNASSRATPAMSKQQQGSPASQRSDEQRAVQEPWVIDMALALCDLQPLGCPASSSASMAACALLDWLGKDTRYLHVDMLSPLHQSTLLAASLRLDAHNHPLVPRLQRLLHENLVTACSAGTSPAGMTAIELLAPFARVGVQVDAGALHTAVQHALQGSDPQQPVRVLAALRQFSPVPSSTAAHITQHLLRQLQPTIGGSGSDAGRGTGAGRFRAGKDSAGKAAASKAMQAQAVLTTIQDVAAMRHPPSLLQALHFGQPMLAGCLELDITVAVKLLQALHAANVTPDLVFLASLTGLFRYHEQNLALPELSQAVQLLSSMRLHHRLATRYKHWLPSAVFGAREKDAVSVQLMGILIMRAAWELGHHPMSLTERAAAAAVLQDSVSLTSYAKVPAASASIGGAVRLEDLLQVYSALAAMQQVHIPPAGHHMRGQTHQKDGVTGARSIHNPQPQSSLHAAQQQPAAGLEQQQGDVYSDYEYLAPLLSNEEIGRPKVLPVLQHWVQTLLLSSSLQLQQLLRGQSLGTSIASPMAASQAAESHLSADNAVNSMAASSTVPRTGPRLRLFPKDKIATASSHAARKRNEVLSSTLDVPPLLDIPASINLLTRTAQLLHTLPSDPQWLNLRVVTSSLAHTALDQLQMALTDLMQQGADSSQQTGQLVHALTSCLLSPHAPLGPNRFARQPLQQAADVLATALVHHVERFSLANMHTASLMCLLQGLGCQTSFASRQLPLLRTLRAELCTRLPTAAAQHYRNTNSAGYKPPVSSLASNDSFDESAAASVTSQDGMATRDNVDDVLALVRVLQQQRAYLTAGTDKLSVSQALQAAAILDEVGCSPQPLLEALGRSLHEAEVAGLATGHHAKPTQQGVHLRKEQSGPVLTLPSAGAVQAYEAIPQRHQGPELQQELPAATAAPSELHQPTCRTMGGAEQAAGQLLADQGLGTWQRMQQLRRVAQSLVPRSAWQAMYEQEVLLLAEAKDIYAAQHAFTCAQHINNMTGKVSVQSKLPVTGGLSFQQAGGTGVMSHACPTHDSSRSGKPVGAVEGASAAQTAATVPPAAKSAVASPAAHQAADGSSSTAHALSNIGASAPVHSTTEQQVAKAAASLVNDGHHTSDGVDMGACTTATNAAFQWWTRPEAWLDPRMLATLQHHTMHAAHPAGTVEDALAHESRVSQQLCSTHRQQRQQQQQQWEDEVGAQKRRQWKAGEVSAVWQAAWSLGWDHPQQSVAVARYLVQRWTGESGHKALEDMPLQQLCTSLLVWAAKVASVLPATELTLNSSSSQETSPLQQHAQHLPWSWQQQNQPSQRQQQLQPQQQEWQQQQLLLQDQQQQQQKQKTQKQQQKQQQRLQPPQQQQDLQEHQQDEQLPEFLRVCLLLADAMAGEAGLVHPADLQQVSAVMQPILHHLGTSTVLGTASSDGGAHNGRGGVSVTTQRFRPSDVHSLQPAAKVLQSVAQLMAHPGKGEHMATLAAVAAGKPMVEQSGPEQNSEVRLSKVNLKQQKADIAAAYELLARHGQEPRLAASLLNALAYVGTPSVLRDLCWYTRPRPDLRADPEPARRTGKKRGKQPAAAPAAGAEERSNLCSNNIFSSKPSIRCPAPDKLKLQPASHLCAAVLMLWQANNNPDRLWHWQPLWTPEASTKHRDRQDEGQKGLRATAADTGTTSSPTEADNAATSSLTEAEQDLLALRAWVQKVVVEQAGHLCRLQELLGKYRSFTQYQAAHHLVLARVATCLKLPEARAYVERLSDVCSQLEAGQGASNPFNVQQQALLLHLRLQLQQKQ